MTSGLGTTVPRMEPQIDPTDEPPPTTMGLVELLLKAEKNVDRINREPGNQRELFPRFLLISQISTLTFALMTVLVVVGLAVSNVLITREANEKVAYTKG